MTNQDFSHKFTSELLAAILLQVLHHSDDPNMIAEATSPQPDLQKLHQMLVNHNEFKHAQLVTGQRATPAAAPARTRSAGSAPQLVGTGANQQVANLFRAKG